jgi:hypothetical protein
MKNFILSISLFLNVILVAAVGFAFYKALDGCAEISDGRMGVLTKDVQVGYFNTSKNVFTLPKGLVVREADASGIGYFEPFRFRLVVTSENENLVKYDGVDVGKLPNDSEFYSADINLGR